MNLFPQVRQFWNRVLSPAKMIFLVTQLGLRMHQISFFQTNERERQTIGGIETPAPWHYKTWVRGSTYT